MRLTVGDAGACWFFAPITTLPAASAGGVTRHLVVRDREVVVSPGWSIHAGVGIRSYGFCWGMAGENQRYDDMDLLAIADLS